jgi:hypothetical protein
MSRAVRPGAGSGPVRIPRGSRPCPELADLVRPAASGLSGGLAARSPQRRRIRQPWRRRAKPAMPRCCSGARGREDPWSPNIRSRHPAGRPPRIPRSCRSSTCVGPADETVRSGVDGAEYEIDLSAKNAAAFRGKLAPFIDHARKAPGYLSTGRRTRSRSLHHAADANYCRDPPRVPEAGLRPHQACPFRPAAAPVPARLPSGPAAIGSRRA